LKLKFFKDARLLLIQQLSPDYFQSIKTDPEHHVTILIVKMYF